MGVKQLDEPDCSASPVSPKVQAREREARGLMMGRLSFINDSKRFSDSFI